MVLHMIHSPQLRYSLRICSPTVHVLARVPALWTRCQLQARLAQVLPVLVVAEACHLFWNSNIIEMSEFCTQLPSQQLPLGVDC
jgi:hypothetical protein